MRERTRIIIEHLFVAGYCASALIAGLIGANLLMYGFALIATGTTLNKLVVWANGGKMPIGTRMSKESVESLDLTRHKLIDHETKLVILADVFEIESAHFSLRISAGDLLAVAGFALVLYKLLSSLIAAVI